MTQTPADKIEIGAGTVCFRGEDVLLIRRGKKPGLGQWSIPGGRIERGETADAAALRELDEETGVKARLIGLIDVVDAIFSSRTTGQPYLHYLLFDYAAEWISGDPVAGDDAAHAEWISPARLEQLPIWDETHRIIEAARKMVASAAVA